MASYKTPEQFALEELHDKVEALEKTVKSQGMVIDLLRAKLKVIRADSHEPLPNQKSFDFK